MMASILFMRNKFNKIIWLITVQNIIYKNTDNIIIYIIYTK